MNFLKKLFTFGSDAKKIEENIGENEPRPPKQKTHENGIFSKVKTDNAYTLLLSKFMWGSSLKDYECSQVTSYWTPVLGMEANQVIKKFVEHNLIVPANLQIRMNARLGVSDLKKLLKDRGLKVSGKKDQLIKRLVDSDPENMDSEVGSSDIYMCSEKTLPIAEAYIAEEAAIKERTMSKCFDLLNAQELLKAVNLVSEYELGRVIQRGIGADFSDTSQPFKELKTIFSCRPLILKKMTDENIDTLRPLAGMFMLWGVSKLPKKWVPDDYDTGIRLDPITTARMICFYVSHQEEINFCRESGIKKIEILSGGGCVRCSKLNGKVYTLSKVPELPYEHCTCDRGCRCSTVAVSDDIF